MKKVLEDTFAKLGMNQLVYVKPGTHPTMGPGFWTCGADGYELAFSVNRDVAVLLGQQHELTVQLVH